VEERKEARREIFKVQLLDEEAIDSSHQGRALETISDRLETLCLLLVRPILAEYIDIVGYFIFKQYPKFAFAEIKAFIREGVGEASPSPADEAKNQEALLVPQIRPLHD